MGGIAKLGSSWGATATRGEVEDRMNDDITLPLRGVSGEGQVGQLTAMSSYDPASKLPTAAEIDALALYQQLEHSLATNFVALQKTNVPTERQRIWGECLRLAGELEKLTNE